MAELAAENTALRGKLCWQQASLSSCQIIFTSSVWKFSAFNQRGKEGEGVQTRL